MVSVLAPSAMRWWVMSCQAASSTRGKSTPQCSSKCWSSVVRIASFRTLRNLIVGQQDSPLQGEGADGLAVVGVQLGDHVGTIILERVNFRQVARVNEQQSRPPRQTRSRRSPGTKTPAGQTAFRRRSSSTLVDGFHREFILTHPIASCGWATDGNPAAFERQGAPLSSRFQLKDLPMVERAASGHL